VGGIRMKRPSLAHVLRVSNLSVRRGSTIILNGVSWSIAPGQHWVILGPNGSGKTSLLSALTGYLMPTQGEVEVLGQRYGSSDWRELRKRIGLVSSSIRQMLAENEPAIETVISGKDAILDFWGAITAPDRRRARSILRLVECEYLADRPWRVLSQGERQRVLIGRALMADPPLLILDEPCAGLDPVARERFLGFVQRMAAGPMAPALILTTHHVEEIVPTFSHVLLLREGKVIAAGPKEDVLSSRCLTRAFGAGMRVRRRLGRFQLRVDGRA
jgi:iron complex transport system ATP-binding protein